MTRFTVLVVAAALLTARFVTFTAGAVVQGPAIVLAPLPPYGASGRIRGTVSGIRGNAFKVALFIRVADVWFTKPSFAMPAVPIDAQGRFEGTFNTGDFDAWATTIAAFVVPASFTPPRADGTPDIPPAVTRVAIAQAMVTRPPSVRSIQFSGRTWQVKASSPLRIGPGSNEFSDDRDSVLVDRAGRLHLRIKPGVPAWTSAEVWLTKPLGYGRYRFEIETPTAVDPHVVFGLFTWDDDPAPGRQREIDIEVSRWGDPRAPNAQFLIQRDPGSRVRFEATPGVGRFEFEWAPERVRFANEARLHEVTGLVVPVPGNERVHLNAWLAGARQPADLKVVDLVVRSFSFEPLPVTR